MTTPTDPLYGDQWHFSFITNNGSDPSLMELLWEEYSGDGVHVGVYDTGVEYGHVDLNDNYDASLHVVIDGNTIDGITTPGDDDHGTMVAGIIGAELNGEGVVGIAWGASLTSVNIFDSTGAASINAEDPAGFYEAIEQIASFDVTNHSWGADPAHLLDDFDVSTLAGFELAIETGRGGLGTSIVKSAGNDNLDTNGDALNASRYTITVGALLETGVPASYSNYGACLLVSSAGGDNGTNGTRLITTTDVDGSYTDFMNGTSAAAPMVTGIVALMLQANPGLGWRDVQNILALTAWHTGSAIGAGPGQNEDHTWFINDAANWNGGGMHFSEDYGYGNADAYGAVRMAEAYGVIGAAAGTSANEATVTTGTVVSGAAIVDASNNSYDFNLAGSLEIEHVSLTISLTHSAFTDLRIFLVSAEGTEVQLYDGWSWGDAASGLTWTYGIDALRGELAAGTWTLKINDAEANDSGVLDSVRIDAYGSAPGANDTYHFTGEFSEMAALDAARQTLTDADGGSDWIDTSAISAAFPTTLNLSAGSACTIDGASFAIAVGTVIENAVLGDGADTVFGNTAANRLYGMRGNDTMTGESGNDTLEGGKGDDSLNGGSGNDTLVGGAGVDTAYYSGAGAVLVDLSITGVQNTVGAAFDTLMGIENLSGSSSGDILTGDSGANALAGGGGNDTLTGGSGNDTVEGGAGTDSMDGGADNDTISYASAGGAVTLNLAQNTVNIDTDTFTGFESAIGSAFGDTLTGTTGANHLTGADGSDTLVGDAGNDTLDGGDGGDSMDGGVGDDTYVVSEGGEIITDASGVDTVQSSVGITLGSDIEHLTLTGSAAINGLGNENNNFITGNAADNGIGGLEGDDTIVGGAGNDTLQGGSEADSLQGGEGNDHVQGGSGVDSLHGGDGDDNLRGGADNDTVIGGAGSDTADYFHIASAVTVSMLAGTVTSSTDGTDWLQEIEWVYGSNGFADSLSAEGTSAGIQMRGWGGNDTLVSGAGNDWLVGDDGVDTVSYAGSGAVTIDLAIDMSQNTIGAGSDRLTFVENVVGSAFGDTLTGDGSANLLAGAGGNDTLEGAAGDDALDGGADTDTASYAGAGGAVTVSLALAGAQNTSGAGSDTLTGFENLSGSASGDTLTGDNSANHLAGAGGNDTLSGASGDDTLDGGAGNDSLIAGSGVDTVSYTGASAVTVDLSVAGAQNTVSAGLDTLADFENVLGSESGDRLTGNASGNLLSGADGNDTLTGGGGDDVLEGGSGIDSMIGGSGDDFFDGGTEGDNATGGVGADVLLGDAGDDLLEGDQGIAISALAPIVKAQELRIDSQGSALWVDGAFNLDANANIQNALTRPHVTIDAVGGGTGDYYAFTVTAGGSFGTFDIDGADPGCDSYLTLLDAGGTILASSEDFLTDPGSVGGVVTLDSFINHTFASAGTYCIVVSGSPSFEPVVPVGAPYTLHVSLDAPSSAVAGGADTLDGGTGNDTLLGGAGADSLDGGADADLLVGGVGADSMVGGDGNDTYVVDAAGDVVTESSAGGTSDLIRSSVSIGALAAQVERLTLTGTAASGTGNSLANTLTGNNAANSLAGAGGSDSLVGGNGADTLDGGAGGDTMKGGAGNDAYLVNSASDVVIEAAAQGAVDHIQSSVSITALAAEVEKLTLTGMANLKGTANGLANTLTGNSGNNVLNGLAGNDTMAGGTGNDTYVVDAAGDVVTESSAGGTSDLIRSSVSIGALAAQVERLTLTGTAASGTGNSLANTLTGNNAANSLAGAGGSDSLVGGNGADTLDGGTGNDMLTGSAGKDKYDFTVAATAGNADTIVDFIAIDDMIRLDNDVFTAFAAENVKLAGKAFYAGAAAHDSTDRIIYNSATGNLYYDADGTGAASMKLFATLTGTPALTEADFFILA